MALLKSNIIWESTSGHVCTKLINQVRNLVFLNMSDSRSRTERVSTAGIIFRSRGNKSRIEIFKNQTVESQWLRVLKMISIDYLPQWKSTFRCELILYIRYQHFLQNSTQRAATTVFASSEEVTRICFSCTPG